MERSDVKEKESTTKESTAKESKAQEYTEKYKDKEIKVTAEGV